MKHLKTIILIGCIVLLGLCYLGRGDFVQPPQNTEDIEESFYCVPCRIDDMQKMLDSKNVHYVFGFCENIPEFNLVIDSLKKNNKEIDDWFKSIELKDQNNAGINGTLHVAVKSSAPTVFTEYNVKFVYEKYDMFKRFR